VNFPARPRAVSVALIQRTNADAVQRELREFLAADPKLEWRGLLATDNTALQSLAASPPAGVVADLRGSGIGDPAQLFRDLLAASPATQIVALCAPGDVHGAQRALANGAAACLSRRSDPLTVLRAINEVMRGHMHLSPTGQRAIRGILSPGAMRGEHD
jgi:DNA-binding NarL/FixJ family response regulator